MVLACIGCILNDPSCEISTPDVFIHSLVQFLVYYVHIDDSGRITEYIFISVTGNYYWLAFAVMSCRNSATFNNGRLAVPWSLTCYVWN